MPLGSPPLWSPPTPTPKPSGAGPGPWYSDPYLWMNLAGTAGDIWASTSSAAAANETNVVLQREQREWQERMSNSEIQRRKRDYELAGFNPVLAATQGTGASSPSVAAPHVEPTYRGGNSIGATAITAAQLRNINAATAKTMEETRGVKNINDDFERAGPGGRKMGEYRKDTKALIDAVILDTKQVTYDMTAAQLKQFEETTELVVQRLQQMAAREKLDLEAIQSVVSQFGLAGKEKLGLVRSLMNMLLPLMRD